MTKLGICEQERRRQAELTPEQKEAERRRAARLMDESKAYANKEPHR